MSSKCSVYSTIVEQAGSTATVQHCNMLLAVKGQFEQRKLMQEGGYCLCGYGNIHHIASLSLASSCARGYDLDSNSYRQHQFFTRGSNKVILENSFILCTKILFGQQR